MEQRGFKGVWIPKEIWLNNSLSWTEKGLLVEIDSLDNNEGCWATNNHFSSFLGISANRVSRLISNLREKGYIRVHLFYKEGTKQIEKRVIRTTEKFVKYPIVENNNTYCRKQQYPIVESDNDPIVENNKGNNTLTNNTNNNTSNNTSKSLKTDFEELWKLYPNKKGKSKALSAYQKAIADGVPHDIILQGIKSYAADCQKKRTKPEYIAHGSTWFGQRRWEDEYDTKAKDFKFGGSQTSQPTAEDLAAYQELVNGGGF